MKDQYSTLVHLALIEHGYDSNKYIGDNNFQGQPHFLSGYNSGLRDAQKMDEELYKKLFSSVNRVCDKHNEMGCEKCFGRI